MKLLTLFLGVCCLMGCAKEDVAYKDAPGNTIVCFGDSLTEGYMLPQEESYPSVLQQKLKYKIINAGVSGNTTQDALARIDEDVLSHQPKMVIVILGANDFLRHMPIEDTLKNMESIINRIHAQKAMVVWAHVKTGLWGDAHTNKFKALAKQKKVLFIDDVLKGVMFNIEYKLDPIHPNAKGYAVMAERIYRVIKSYLK